MKWMWIPALIVSAVSVLAQQPRALEGVAVSGRITMLEQPGKVATDVGSTVIFLDDRGGRGGAARDVQIRAVEAIRDTACGWDGARVISQSGSLRHNGLETAGATFDIGRTRAGMRERRVSSRPASIDFLPHQSRRSLRVAGPRRIHEAKARIGDVDRFTGVTSCTSA